MEVLHTVLLGPYKYLTGKVMSSLSKVKKTELLAILDTLNYSGINGQMSSNVTMYSQSFVGRDFKVWAQIAPFVLKSFVSQQQLSMRIHLSRVSFFKYMYVHSIIFKVLICIYLCIYHFIINMIAS